MNAHMKSIAAKSVAPRFCTALVLSALVWLGGPRSADAGANVWTATGPYGGQVSALAIDPQTPTTLYAVTGGVFKSTDGGSSWTSANAGLSGPGPQSLVIDPTTPSTLYAGTAAGAFKSTDGAGSWRSSGLAFARIFTLAVDPQTPTTIYAGTGGGSAGGVWKSTNGGANWSPTGPVGRVRALAIDPQTPTTLYAALTTMESSRASTRRPRGAPSTSA